MSAGPIRAERRGHVAPAASTPASERICFRARDSKRSYCGRTPERYNSEWKQVTCSECLAARRADIAAQGGATR